MISFRDVDRQQMLSIEGLVARTVLPFKDTTEAALVIFALVRCARVLLNLYPAGAREALCKVCVSYLQGEPAPRDSGIVIPKGLMS